MSSAPVTDTENESSSNVTSRPRARKRQHGDEICTFMAEVKISIESFKSQQNTMQCSMKDIKKQNDEIIKSMDFISKQYEDLKNNINKMETERKAHLAYIQQLESKVETLERINKQTSVEIRNIPNQKTETKTDLIKIVKKLGDTVSMPVDESCVRDVFRLPNKKGDSPIIVDFSTVMLKEKILISVKSYNKAKKDNKLNTAHLNMNGQPKPIFVSESLTQKMRRIFFLAREFSKNNGYTYCWTAHGKVFLRKKEGYPARSITEESDLHHLKTQSDM